MREEVQSIMLRNWDTAEMAKVVTFATGKVPLEASGNVTVERIREMGVDFISVHSITHSFKLADFSLLLSLERKNHAS